MHHCSVVVLFIRPEMTGFNRTGFPDLTGNPVVTKARWLHLVL